MFFQFLLIIIFQKKKEIFIKKIKESLKNTGILIFTEIYLPKELCVKYYDKVFEEISEPIQGLKEFLRQTAESSDFEFKVTKNYANKQLLDNGFTKIEEVKIWPLDNTFDQEIGTFVEVFRY